MAYTKISYHIPRTTCLRQIYNSVTIYSNLVIRKLNSRANKVKGRGENTQFSGIIYNHGTSNEPRKSTKYVKKYQFTIFYKSYLFKVVLKEEIRDTVESFCFSLPWRQT